MASRDTAFTWPEVHGFTRQGPDFAPTPELGYSVLYSAKRGVTVTVYVYDRGVRGIPDGIDSQVVKTEAAQSFFEMLGSPIWSETPEPAIDDEDSLGSHRQALPMLHQSAAGTDLDGNDVQSHLYIRGGRGSFIKIRTTYRTALGKESEAMLANLWVALGRALS
jgi:hypothetical protein